MTFTKEQMDALAPYEKYFITSVRSKWCSYPGADALRRIHQIYTQATGNRLPLNVTCGRCMSILMRNAGEIYLKDKAEMEAAEFMRKSLHDAAERHISQFDGESVQDEAPKKKTTKKKTTKK